VIDQSSGAKDPGTEVADPVAEVAGRNLRSGSYSGEPVAGDVPGAAEPTALADLAAAPPKPTIAEFLNGPQRGLPESPQAGGAHAAAPSADVQPVPHAEPHGGDPVAGAPGGPPERSPDAQREVQEIADRSGRGGLVVDTGRIPEAAPLVVDAAQRLVGDFSAEFGDWVRVTSEDFGETFAGNPAAHDMYAYAKVNGGEKTIALNEAAFRDPAALAERLAAEAADGWTVPSGGTIEGVLHHEFGHHLANRILTDPILRARLNEAVGGVLGRPYDAALPHNDPALRTAVEQNLSTHGAEDPHQMIAEAFADHKLAQNPRPLAKAIGRVIDEYVSEGDALTPSTPGGNVGTELRAGHPGGEIHFRASDFDHGTAEGLTHQYNASRDPNDYDGAKYFAERFVTGGALAAHDWQTFADEAHARQRRIDLGQEQHWYEPNGPSYLGLLKYILHKEFGIDPQLLDQLSAPPEGVPGVRDVDPGAFEPPGGPRSSDPYGRQPDPNDPYGPRPDPNDPYGGRPETGGHPDPHRPPGTDPAGVPGSDVPSHPGAPGHPEPPRSGERPEDPPNTWRDRNGQLRGAGGRFYVDPTTTSDYDVVADIGGKKTYTPTAEAAEQIKGAVASRDYWVTERDNKYAELDRLHSRLGDTRSVDSYLSGKSLENQYNIMINQARTDPNLTGPERERAIQQANEILQVGRDRIKAAKLVVARTEEMAMIAAKDFAAHGRGGKLLTPTSEVPGKPATADVVAYADTHQPTLIIVEAKGGGSQLGGRNTTDANGNPVRAQQGTPSYLEAILGLDSDLKGALKADKATRKKLEEAVKNGTLKIEYHLIRSTVKGKITHAEFTIKNPDGSPFSPKKIAGLTPDERSRGIFRRRNQ
jgi:hypothetical protein